jgi:hypothetical protein
VSVFVAADVEARPAPEAGWTVAGLGAGGVGLGDVVVAGWVWSGEVAVLGGVVVPVGGGVWSVVVGVVVVGGGGVWSVVVGVVVVAGGGLFAGGTVTGASVPAAVVCADAPLVGHVPAPAAAAAALARAAGWRRLPRGEPTRLQR